MDKCRSPPGQLYRVYVTSPVHHVDILLKQLLVLDAISFYKRWQMELVPPVPQDSILLLKIVSLFVENVGFSIRTAKLPLLHATIDNNSMLHLAMVVVYLSAIHFMINHMK